MIVKKGAESIILATYPSLLKSIRRRVRDGTTAEDIIQTACAAVLGDPEFDPTRPRRGWLHQAKGMLARTRPPAQARPVSRPTSRQPRRPTDDSARPGHRTRQTSVWVRSGVAQLPKNLRDVMTLHLEGLDHNQIAADLDLPIRVVYTSFHRAKLALHRILEQ